MEKIQYTGLNFAEIQKFTEGKVLAPYDCMGFSMLSLPTEDDILTIHEGDWILRDESGNFTVSFDGEE